jgi:hypothetical protein
MQFRSVMALALMTLLSGACGDDTATGTRKRPPATDNNRVRPPLAANAGLTSTMHRDRGVSPLTREEEISRLLKNELPRAYRAVPDMEKDDEGRDGFSVISQQRIGRPAVPCGNGLAFTGIRERIKDCQQKNPEHWAWDGALLASAGEGMWELVSVNAGAEIWLDKRTGMVWSEMIESGNWCQAAGNDQQPGDLISVDCNGLMAGKRICPDFSASGVGEVVWRLPTRNDYLQADINGLRFVLKHKNSTPLWTATMVAGSQRRREAWTYHPGNGTLQAQELSSSLQVRCIGAPRN